MSDALLSAIIVAFALAIALTLAVAVARARRARPPRDGAVHANPRSVGVGTVRTVGAPDQPVVVIEVESVSGQRFLGRLCHRDGDPAVSALRPGVILLVSFDPDTRDRLSLADDMLAVRAEFDHMLLRKGLLTDEQLNLIRHGARSSGVVTGMRTTGEAREDYREVELDLMVSRLGGGQFPAHDTALVPASALVKVYPGSVVDTYYRPGDESTIAVCVPPA